MLIKALEIVILLVLSIISDQKTYKIKNAITLPFAALGLATNFFMDGFAGIQVSIVGWLVPVAVLFLLYALKMLGPGDIKLFGAVGAIMGVEFVLYSMAYSFLIGGVIGVIYLIIRKNGFSRLKYLINYLKACLITRSLLEYSDFKDHSAGDKFRFSYAIVPGVLTELMIFYITKA